MTELTTTPSEKTRLDFLSRPLLTAATLDWEKILYAAFILVALVTRLWALGERVMSHDESLHTQYSLQYFRGEGYRHTPLMHGPFLFHATALFYWLFGASDFSARLPVALLGVLLVAMPYFLRPWLGRLGALVTSFLFLVSPFITYYSRYIRHDIYVITWAMIIFIATWYYLQRREEKFLWIFAAALALMFSTKEVSFIYVAIFGSFLVLRLAVRLWQAPWFRSTLPDLRRPLLVLVLAILLFGAGFGGLHLAERNAAEAEATVTPVDEQGFAADPLEDTQSGAMVEEEHGIWRWLQVAGALSLGIAALLFVRILRPYVDDYGEFDLIMLYSTLILPMVAPFLVVLAGYPPRDFTINRCELAGEATMSSLELFLGRVSQPVCVQTFLASNMVIYGIFVVLTLAAAVAVGLWWNRRRWTVAAIIFHSIFFILYTSVFTNPSGWFSGIYDSLAYWLEQQEVARGGQPNFYYLFLVPFYEFLPLLLSLLAIRLWARRHRLNEILLYWVPLGLITLLLYSFVDWFTGLPNNEGNTLLAAGLAALVLIVGGAYWLFVRAKQVREQYELESWSQLIDPDLLLGFVPSVIWWLLLTWIAYSVAGEKMPWLSTHFVIPMALLGGWYLNETLAETDLRDLFSRTGMAFIGLVAVALVAFFLAFKPLFRGEIHLGDQGLANLTNLGSFLGALLIAAVLFYLVRQLGERLARPVRIRGWLLALLLLLTLLTVRFTYMTTWPNADYTTEFMVYAHAAPAIKEVVMPQIEELSQRMHGDRSLKVAWSSDVTWPMQWYLKDYPNRFYAAEMPTASIRDYPVVVVGSLDWANFDQFLTERDYEKRDYIFLWWPMEEYRKIGWNALLGLETAFTDEGEAFTTQSGRGIFSSSVRRSLWDIFFHRDYEQFGNTFGGTYTAGEWPLRHELRMYIRRDVLANLWDYGVGATAIQPPVDPYADGELLLTPDLVIGDGGINEGLLLAPRNVEIGPDGNIYVLDSGNHRVVVLDQEGQLLHEWGSPGTAAGQFNEPWGLAVDEEAVYVADTWNHRIQKFTLDGEWVSTFGQYGSVADMGIGTGDIFFGPRSIALLPDNQLLVTDTGNHRLLLYSRDGTFIRASGQLGAGAGQFNEPVGIASGDGSVYLADTWNARIQRFTEDLLPVVQWPVDGWEGNSTDNKPYLAVDGAGRVYATDPENFRILIFGPDGTYLNRFGQPGTRLDQFGLPNGIALDEAGNIYITDARNNRVLRFPAIEFGNSDSLPLEDQSEEESLDLEEQLPLEGEQLPGDDTGIEEPTGILE